ncbi:MAG: hypothetical protein ACK6DC_20825 [Planctomycetota bacterium]|jgi:hypothetical protein
MSRLIELADTSLFGGEAVVTTFEGKEGLSQHFEYFLTIDSPKPALTPADVIGKPIGFQLNRESGSPRYLHGISTKNSKRCHSRYSGIKSSPRHQNSWVLFGYRRFPRRSHLPPRTLDRSSVANTSEPNAWVAQISRHESAE